MLLIASLLTVTPVLEPSYAALLQDAASSGRPVFLDVFTTWCAPCKKLDREVFPTPEMKAALKPYRFQRLNGEGASQEVLTRRFNILSYPQLIVLTPDGTEVTRLEVGSASSLAEELLDLAPLARTRGPITEAELLRRPHDAGLAYLLALEAERRGDPGAMAQHLEQAEKEDVKDAGQIASRAAWKQLRLLGPEVSRAKRMERLLAFARTYAGSAFSVRALEGLSVLQPRGAPVPPEVHPTVLAVAEGLAARKRTAPMNRLVYVALSLGDPEGAVKVGERLHATSTLPADRQALAEAYFQTGRREEALTIETVAVKRDPLLAGTLARFKSGKPGLTPELFSATDAFAITASERLALEAREHGGSLEAVSKTVSALAEACRVSLPAKATGVSVALTFTAGRVSAVKAAGHGATVALQGCLDAEAKKLPPGEASLSGVYTLHLTPAK